MSLKKPDVASQVEADTTHQKPIQETEAANNSASQTTSALPLTEVASRTAKLPAKQVEIPDHETATEDELEHFMARASKDQIVEFFLRQGIEVDLNQYGLFPTIVLKGMFETSSGMVLNAAFDAAVTSATKKTLYKKTNADGGKVEGDDKETFYSYDGSTVVGRDYTVADRLEEWKTCGYKHQTSEYRELSARLVSGDYDGEMVLIQVSPTSRSVWDGYVVGLGFKGKQVRNLVTHFKKGKALGSGEETYNLWEFSAGEASPYPM